MYQVENVVNNIFTRIAYRFFDENLIVFMNYFERLEFTERIEEAMECYKEAIVDGR